MRLVVQRVSKAKVSVNSTIVGSIDIGCFVLVGIGQNDNQGDADTLAQKLLNLRIMADENNKMNLSLLDIGGEILLIPQFTLYAETKQRRPSFVKAGKPEMAEPLFNYLVDKVKKSGLKVETGVFGAMMQIESTADGPVTILLES